MFCKGVKTDNIVIFGKKWRKPLILTILAREYDVRNACFGAKKGFAVKLPLSEIVCLWSMDVQASK